MLPHFSVTFCLNGTKTLASSLRITDNPSFLSSGNETHLASAKYCSKLIIIIITRDKINHLHRHSGVVPFQAPLDVQMTAEDPDNTYPKLHWHLTRSPK